MCKFAFENGNTFCNVSYATDDRAYLLNLLYNLFFQESIQTARVPQTTLNILLDILFVFFLHENNFEDCFKLLFEVY